MGEKSREQLSADVMTGGCQCGAVRFSARVRLDTVHVCHCRMCQRATGGLFAPMVGVPLETLTWHGQPARFESSEGIERGFCAACGTPLFYATKGATLISLMQGAFDDPAALGDLRYEWGVESTLPQSAQVTRCARQFVSEEQDPEGAARAARSSRQDARGR